MRTIVQQLLRGKPVEMSEEAKKEAEKEKEKYLSLLPQFRALLSEKEFDALKKQMEDYARIDPVICEDYYAEGLRFGIILGMETAFPASKENSVLDRLFFAGLYSFENICLSGKSKDLYACQDSNNIFWHTVVQKDLVGEYNDLDRTAAEVYAYGHEEYLYEGFRIGLILGFEAASLLRRENA